VPELTGLMLLRSRLPELVGCGSPYPVCCEGGAYCCCGGWYCGCACCAGTGVGRCAAVHELVQRPVSHDCEDRKDVPNAAKMVARSGLSAIPAIDKQFCCDWVVSPIIAVKQKG